MKKILFRMLLFVLVLGFPTVAYASGGISISPTSMNVEVGKTRTFTISAINTHGAVTLSSSDSEIATININSWETGEVEAGKTTSETITVTGVSEGTATISIDVDATTFDDETITGTKTVTVKVISVSSNNNLSALKIDDVSVPNFDSSKTSYDIETEKASVNITATAEDTKSTITGTGNKSLKYGKNVYQVKVTAENGSVKTYTLNITRNDTRDANNYLKSLSTNIGTINFNKDTLSYSLTVDSDVEKLVISAEPESSKSKVSGTGDRTLKYGENKLEVKVTAENETLKTYVINVTRTDNRDDNNYLSSLTTDKGDLGFNRETLSYSLTVSDDVETIAIAAVTESAKAKITGDGVRTLKTGSNKLEVKVTAENETVRTYVITVTRLEKDNTKYINSLTIDNADFTFDPDVLNYSISLDEEQMELIFNYELEEGVLISIEGNENLQNNSIVVLKVTKDEKFKEYTFNIVKPSSDVVVTDNNKPKSKKWIVYVLVVVLLAVVGAISGKKKKEAKAQPEVPNIDMGISLPENETVTDTVNQNVSEVDNSGVDVGNSLPQSDNVVGTSEDIASQMNESSIVGNEISQSSESSDRLDI